MSNGRKERKKMRTKDPAIDRMAQWEDRLVGVNLTTEQLRSIEELAIKYRDHIDPYCRRVSLQVEEALSDLASTLYSASARADNPRLSAVYKAYFEAVQKLQRIEAEELKEKDEVPEGENPAIRG